MHSGLEDQHTRSVGVYSIKQMAQWTGASRFNVSSWEDCSSLGLSIVWFSGSFLSLSFLRNKMPRLGLSFLGGLGVGGDRPMP